MQTEKLDAIYKWLWIVLVILAVFLSVKTLGGLMDLGNIDPAYNSITVSGVGEVIAIPDLAAFSFSVSADADTVAAAQNQVTEKMDAILKAFKDFGIEEKDIKTTDYSVWPKYRYLPAGEAGEVFPAIYLPIPGRQVADGYTVSHSVSIKVRDTSKAGQVLAIAGENGATNLSGVSFTVDDPEEITDEARALAIKDAREKAKTLSKELGVRLVRVVSFYDGSDGGVVPLYREGMGGDVSVSQAKAPTLPTGENKVKVVVNVTYEIR